MIRISKISFPGFNIGEFDVQSVAFSIGSIEIAWYAIIITLGMVCAVSYIVYRAKDAGLSFDDVIDFPLFAIPIGVVGARLYFVMSKPESFNSFLEIINIRSGGLAIYGGLLAGALTVLVVAKIKKIPFMVIGDCAMPGIILAQAIGRWGNFANGEAFGYETDIFCRMGLNNILTGFETVYVHPTFLYESLWNILGFVLVNVFYKKRKYDGQVFFAVCAWYGLGRMLIEGLRSDSLYASIFGLEFRTSQVLAGLILIICIAFIVYFEIKKPDKPMYYKNNKKVEKGK